MLLHISRSAAEQALWLLNINTFAKYSEAILEDMVMSHFNCNVLVYEDLYVDDFKFGRYAEERLSVQERMQVQTMTIGNLSGKFIPNVYNKTKTIG